MTTDAPDPRHKAILHAAWTAFSTYGFRKTSMDDIARGAGLSRTALYQYFRNKEDICRQLVAFYYDDACRAVAEALARETAPQDAFAAAFPAQFGSIMDTMLESPHGEEIMDASMTVAAEELNAGEARLAAIYADWLRVAAQDRRIAPDADPEQMAATIAAALKGVKKSASNAQDLHGHLNRLAWTFGRALAR
jgi:AcrR family transcriptional regulator